MVQLSHAATVALLAGSALAALGEEREREREHEGREREREAAAERTVVPPARRSLHARHARSSSSSAELASGGSGDLATDPIYGGSSHAGRHHHRHGDDSSLMPPMEADEAGLDQGRKHHHKHDDNGSSSLYAGGRGSSQFEKRSHNYDSSMPDMDASESSFGKVSKHGKHEDARVPPLDAEGSGYGKSLRHHGHEDQSMQLMDGGDSDYGMPQKHSKHKGYGTQPLSDVSDPGFASGPEHHGRHHKQQDEAMQAAMVGTDSSYGAPKKHHHHRQGGEDSMGAMSGQWKRDLRALQRRSVIGNFRLGEPHPGAEPHPMEMLEVPCPGECGGPPPSEQHEGGQGPPGQMRFIGHIKSAENAAEPQRPEHQQEQHLPFPIFPLPHPPSLFAEALQQQQPQPAHHEPPRMLMFQQKDAEQPQPAAEGAQDPKKVDPGMVAMISRLKEKMPGKLWNNPDGFTVQHTLRFRPGGATEKKGEGAAGKVLAAAGAPLPPPRPVLRALILKLKHKGDGPDAEKAKKLHELDRHVIEKLLKDKEGLEAKLKAKKKALKKQKAALKKAKAHAKEAHSAADAAEEGGKAESSSSSSSKAGSGSGHGETESNTISITESSTKPESDKAGHDKEGKKSEGGNGSGSGAGSAGSEGAAGKHEGSGSGSGSEGGEKNHASKHQHQHPGNDKHRHHARSFVPRSAEAEADPEAWANPEAEAEAEADPGVWADEETFFYEQ